MELNGDAIVGVDASTQSHEAAAWILKELRGTGHRLRLIHVITPDQLDSSNEAALRVEGEEALNRLRDRLSTLDAGHPDGPSGSEILAEVVTGVPAEQLSALAADAGLLVLGHHGADQVDSRRIGTVSFGLPGHALCSVLVHTTRGGSEFDDPVAHPSPPAGRGVVVGLDTSEYSGLAALDAADVARDNGLPLRLLVGIDAFDDVSAARRTAEADRDWLCAEFPGLEAELEFRNGDPAEMLIHASADSDLVVIGKRGIGRFAAMTTQLGQTSSAVLSAALSSVLLVTYRDDPRLEERSRSN